MLKTDVISKEVNVSEPLSVCTSSRNLVRTGDLHQITGTEFPCLDLLTSEVKSEYHTADSSNTQRANSWYSEALDFV